MTEQFNEMAICNKWKKYVSLDFNFYDSEDGLKKELSVEELFDIVKDSKEPVVINAGHFIPVMKNKYDNPGKNPQKTWELGCDLVASLIGGGT